MGTRTQSSHRSHRTLDPKNSRRPAPYDANAMGLHVRLQVKLHDEPAKRPVSMNDGGIYSSLDPRLPPLRTSPWAASIIAELGRSRSPRFLFREGKMRSQPLAANHKERVLCAKGRRGGGEGWNGTCGEKGEGAETKLKRRDVLLLLRTSTTDRGQITAVRPELNSYGCTKELRPSAQLLRPDAVR